MIPQRIKLKGFLCYKDEQEVAFDGASLWMLAGLNGSGKSAIFDAVTYALFGYHRGGKAEAQELINKDCDRLLVEFEFTLDGKPHLAKRTLQLDARGNSKGSQLMQRRADGANGKGGWVAVDGTDKKVGFDAWVRDNIGLDYETFTSSVLLLQGKAEKLLDSTAKGRFEVLAGIVDLDRYERLHARADEQRKKQAGVADTLHNRLAGLPEVTADRLAEAERCITEVEEARRLAEAEVERLLDAELRARQWADFQRRFGEARQRWQQAQQLLTDAADIQRAVDRLEELRDVLPRLQTVVEQRTQIHQSEAQTELLVRQKTERDTALTEKNHLIDQTRLKRTSLETQIDADEQKHDMAARQLLAKTAQLEKLNEFESQQTARGKLLQALADLPADPEAERTAMQETCDRLNAVALAAPLLTQLHARREELRQDHVRARSAASALKDVQQKGEQLAERARELRPRAEEASRLARDAADQATTARTLMEQARQQLDEISNLQGAKVCRHCGQELTEGHLRDEKRRREKDVAQTEARYHEAAGRLQTAQKHEKQQLEQLAQFDQQLAAAREEFRDHQRQEKQAKDDAIRHERDCGLAHAELAEPFRGRVAAAPPADWLATSYPTADDLAALQREKAGLLAARQRLQDATALVQRWHGLKAQELTVTQNLARLQAGLPADPSAVRQDHVRLAAEAKALDDSLKALRAAMEASQQQLDRLGKEREAVQAQLAEVQGKLRTEEATRQHCQQALSRALQELPPAWQKAAESAASKDLYVWQGEREDLEKKGIDERDRQLAQARVNAETLKQNLDALEQEERQFPAEARQEPGRIALLLGEARKAKAQRDGDFNFACQRKTRLEEDRRQREQLGQELLEAEKELAHAEKLAKLLGRDRLQLYLVRQAEKQVVDHANAVLDRLSGGQLFLRLCGSAEGEGNSAKALELEAYNRVTGEKPINVAFLSGSQKFRVAVSLALGIGQYASKQHRPIESVIIDEGFGCLDKEGRQAMIQELQNLRGQLRCILLVSHQEEFADAFNDGYRFELQDGATKVSRFQR